MEHFCKYMPALVIIAALSLSACGIKPGDLEPPPGAENTKFPKTYPAEGSE